jgi:hypothetical protein
VLDVLAYNRVYRQHGGKERAACIGDVRTRGGAVVLRDFVREARRSALEAELR